MGIRFAVESSSGLLWNLYPLSRGITVRIGVEYTLECHRHWNPLELELRYCCLLNVRAIMGLAS